MRSISSLERRPLSLVMVMCLDFPVVLSEAETFKIPLASMLKVTSTWGIPRGAGGMSDSSNLPSKLLSLVRAQSPSYTWISTPGWLSEKVVKISDFMVGTVVLRLMREVMIPPAVSIPREIEATSRKRRSRVFSEVSPERMAAWTAAP